MQHYIVLLFFFNISWRSWYFSMKACMLATGQIELQSSYLEYNRVYILSCHYWWLFCSCCGVWHLHFYGRGHQLPVAWNMIYCDIAYGDSGDDRVGQWQTGEEQWRPAMNEKRKRQLPRQNTWMAQGCGQLQRARIASRSRSSLTSLRVYRLICSACTEAAACKHDIG